MIDRKERAIIGSMTKIGKEEELFCRMPGSREQIFHFGEVVGLASGAKKAAFLEIRRKGELDEFMGQLFYFAPERSFCLEDAPGTDWQAKTIGEFDRNVIIGEDTKVVSTIKEIFKAPEGSFSQSELGKFLSYPECCSGQRGLSGSNKWLSGSRVNQIDFRINNFLIRTTPNVMLIRHYLCDYDCEASIRYASKVLRFLENFPETFEFVEKVLQMPVMIPPQGSGEHLLRHGTPFLFDGFYEDEKTLRYDKIYPLSKPLTPSVDMGRRTEVALKAMLSGNRVIVRGGGMEILSGSEKKTFLDGDFIFVWPQKKPPK